MKFDSMHVKRTADAPTMSYGNVKESRLNAGSDQDWRGKRSGTGSSNKGKMPY